MYGRGSSCSRSQTTGSAPASSRSLAWAGLRIRPRGLCPAALSSRSRRSAICPCPPAIRTSMGRRLVEAAVSRHTGAGHANPMRLEDKVVIITGASAGIGRATALELARRGARVGLIARGRERLESAKREIEQEGGTAAVAVADVADHQALERAASEL